MNFDRVRQWLWDMENMELVLKDSKLKIGPRFTLYHKHYSLEPRRAGLRMEICLLIVLIGSSIFDFLTHISYWLRGHQIDGRCRNSKRPAVWLFAMYISSRGYWVLSSGGRFEPILYYLLVNCARISARMNIEADLNYFNPLSKITHRMRPTPQTGFLLVNDPEDRSRSREVSHGCRFTAALTVPWGRRSIKNRLQ